MADRNVSVGTPLGKQGHSAIIALGDDEVRRWETHCRGLEEGEVYPWAETESRALIGSIFACLFGADVSVLEAPSRSWARTNCTMAIFTRRLGCLRELVSQESVMNGPESFERLQEIFDRVTIVATEAALASLSYVDTPLMRGSMAGPQDIAAASDSIETGSQANARSRFSRALVSTLVMLAIAALVVGFAFAFAPSGAHRPIGPAKPGYVKSTQQSTGTASAGGVPSSNGRGGSGKSDAPGSTSVTTPGGSSGATGTGSNSGGPAGSGTQATVVGSTTSGTSGSTGTGTQGSNAQDTGTGGSGSGSTTVTLPGGISATVPPITLPQVTLPGGTTISTPPITLPRL
jgi:hypothetical protein